MLLVVKSEQISAVKSSDLFLENVHISLEINDYVPSSNSQSYFIQTEFR